MQIDLNDRHAVVLGGSQGLGLATVRALVGAGGRVTVVSRSADQEALVQQGLSADLVEAVPADLTQPEELRAALARARARFGPVDTLVLSGGGPPPGTFLALSDEQWTAAFEQLLLSPVRAIRAVLPDMQAQQFGRIIVFLSSGVKQPLPNLMLSNALRAATLGMLQTLAREVIAQGVTVNGIIPGRIDTARVQALDQAAAGRLGVSPEEVKRRSLEAIPIGRYGRPEEFAFAAVMLAARESGYITGSTIEVDGGYINTLS